MTRSPSCFRSGCRALVPALLLSAAVGACAEQSPTAPVADAAPVRTASVITGTRSVANLQLRALAGLSSYAWGNAQLGINALPVDPCKVTLPATVPAGYTPVTVCATIFNKGGINFRSGRLVQFLQTNDVLPQTVAAVWGQGAIPTDPCRRYEISGYTLVQDQVARELVGATSNFGLYFGGEAPGTTTTTDQIGAFIDGAAWGSAASITSSDAYFTANVCSIAVTPGF